MQLWGSTGIPTEKVGKRGSNSGPRCCWAHRNTEQWFVPREEKESIARKHGQSRSESVSGLPAYSNLIMSDCQPGLAIITVPQFWSVSAFFSLPEWV